MRRAQFAFHEQWRALRSHAHRRGIRLFGDVPIYVAPDSVETWAHREQFRTDVTLGAPPDDFSADGQRLGRVGQLFRSDSD
ncbi:MAG: 4-alpha-glucanotransferase, partial [Proteobacteria bacterium]|nr:4-alpha-glucanotransferase [Pseudomonadota bacterium]